MQHITHTLLEQSIALWQACSTSLPDLGASQAKTDQQEKETLVAQFMQALLGDMQRMPLPAAERTAVRQRLVAASSYFSESVLGLDGASIDWILASGLVEASAEFARQARRFDPGFTDADIYQASRNAWTMYILQVLLGMPVSNTPSIFAYSMLYPYTDNYLDDPGVSAHSKSEFNHLLRLKLLGETVHPSNEMEARVCDLVGMIEGEFQRAQYPQIYDCLLAIHRAQTESVALLAGRNPVSPDESMRICFMKGGLSVLADGYLLLGDLSPVLHEVCFGYGVFTQLLDDLEDVQQDVDSGLMTLYALQARQGSLDEITNRTFQFGIRVMHNLDCFEDPAAQPLKKMIQASIAPLLVEAAGNAAPYYSKRYLKQLERRAPLRFAFMRRQREAMLAQSLSVINLIELLTPGEE